jgi:hypothetical protein
VLPVTSAREEEEIEMANPAHARTTCHNMHALNEKMTGAASHCYQEPRDRPYHDCRLLAAAIAARWAQS